MHVQQQLGEAYKEYVEAHEEAGLQRERHTQDYLGFKRGLRIPWERRWGDRTGFPQDSMGGGGERAEVREKLMRVFR